MDPNAPAPTDPAAPSGDDNGQMPPVTTPAEPSEPSVPAEPAAPAPSGDPMPGDGDATGGGGDASGGSSIPPAQPA